MNRDKFCNCSRSLNVFVFLKRRLVKVMNTIILSRTKTRNQQVLFYNNLLKLTRYVLRKYVNSSVLTCTAASIPQ